MSQGTGAASVAPEFPIVLAAIEDHEGSSKWKIADATLLTLGAPPAHGVNDGSSARAQELSQFLAERGHPEWSAKTLMDMRWTAHRFGTSTRRSSCSFAAHDAAASPELLDEAVRRNSGKPVSRRFVEQMRREIREAEEAAERKRQADKRRRADEKLAAERRKAQEARDADERRKAEQRAEQARQRTEQLMREHEEAEAKRQERRRKEADAKAERLARELEDKDVAEALARNKSVGARRVTNAVHEREAARRRKVQAENEHRRNAEALPLPAFVPKMIGDIDGWAIAMRGITDDDLAGLPDNDPLVRQLANVVEELNEQSRRWLVALGRGDLQLPDLELIEGVVR